MLGLNLFSMSGFSVSQLLKKSSLHKKPQSPKLNFLGLFFCRHRPPDIFSFYPLVHLGLWGFFCLALFPHYLHPLTPDIFFFSLLGAFLSCYFFHFRLIFHQLVLIPPLISTYSFIIFIYLFKNIYKEIRRKIQVWTCFKSMNIINSNVEMCKNNVSLLFIVTINTH